MPLPTSAPRKAIHARDIVCRGYRREDGLWDIEGHLTDTKSYSFENHERGHVPAGEPIHDMWIRLTIDDELEVKGVEAVTDYSPYRVCGGITANFQRLVGLRIAGGWTRAVKERLGGVEGCTHLVELLGPLATVAFQTIAVVVFQERLDKARAEGRVDPLETSRPMLMDTCHALASDGEVAHREWPAFYTGPAREAAE